MRLFLLLFPVFALAATDWQALLNANHGERVHFGVVLGGTDPYQASENEDFAPASTAKLFTAGLALATLSPDYRYPTLLRWTESTAGTASNVTLVGSGDPSWGLSELHEGLRDRLDAYAAALRAAGIETVRGDLRAVAADPRWNNVTIPEGWKEADSTSCGGSLAQGFNLDLNCATLTITSASSATWKSEGLELPVALAIDAGPSTSLSVKLVPNGQSFAYRVSGTFKAGGGPHSYTLPIYDTRSWAANLLRSALAAKGIKFEPAAGDEDAGTPKQLVFYSAPLGELIKPFLKNSVNFMGDAFLKTVGAQSGFEESDSSLLAPGLSRLYAFLGGGRD
ncbi:MAG: D-alanyl-D-alanine carboxypeptidase, partial [Bdellovibrionota bacterium]